MFFLGGYAFFGVPSFQPLGFSTKKKNTKPPGTWRLPTWAPPQQWISLPKHRSTSAPRWRPSGAKWWIPNRRDPWGRSETLKEDSIRFFPPKKTGGKFTQSSYKGNIKSKHGFFWRWQFIIDNQQLVFYTAYLFLMSVLGIIFPPIFFLGAWKMTPFRGGFI